MATRATLKKASNDWLAPTGTSAGARRVAEFREITVKVVNMLSERKINVTQRGTGAYVRYATDGTIEVLNLPYIPDDATEQLLSAIRGFLDHEVAHVLFTDQNARRAELDGTPKEDQKKLESLWNVLEDTFIERMMRQKFPGSGANLSFLTRFVADRLQIPKLNEAVAAKDHGSVFSIGLVPLMYAWSGDDEAARVVKEMNLEKLIPKEIDALKEFQASIAAIESTDDAAKLAKRIYAKLKKAATPPPPPPPPAPSAEEEDEGEGDPDDSEGNAPPKDDQPQTEEPEQEADASPSEGEADEDGEGEGETDDTQPQGEEGSEEPEQPDAPEGDSDNEDSDTSPDEGDDSESESDGDSEGENQEDQADAKDEPDDTNTSSEESDEASSEPGETVPTGTGDIQPESEELKDEEAEKESDNMPTEVALEILDNIGEGTPSAADVISVMARASIRSGTYLPYTTDWDTVIPVPLKPELLDQFDAQITKLDEKVRHTVGGLQQSLRRLFAQQEQVANQGGMRSGRLDASNLYRLATSDDRVFSRREEHHATDTAVTLLIDNSGSMSGQKLTLACESAYALSQTLDRLNITHEILGFTTNERGSALYTYADGGAAGEQLRQETIKLGRDFSRISPIVTYEYKRFDERTSVNTKRRLVAAPGALDRAGRRTLFPKQVECEANVDGESLLIAAARLKKQRQPRKILIVLSDGYPSASGDGDHLMQHLAFAVQDCERQKIETLGIGIMDSAVKQYYPKSVVINKVEDLPTAVVTELSKFLLAKR